MAKTVHARTIAVQSLDYKYRKLIIPPYEVDVEFTPQEEAALDSGITADMIPSTAGANNRLADEQYVNNAVSEYSAQFLGTSAQNLTEQQFLAWANTLDADNNDYCYWWTVDSDSKTIYKRYKYNGTDWLFEYNVADPSSVPTALSQLTDDDNHRLVTDTEKSTWNNKADTTDIPSALSELSEDTTHRVVTDTEKGTWNGKADVGTSQDDKTANTIYGAKAFATDADKESAYFEQNFAVIAALSENPNAGTTTVTTNPEWKIVYTDYEDKILAGKRQDNTWYFAVDLDIIIDTIIGGYVNP